jgi:uncharacterized delta-60 repeat protein
MPAIFSPKRTPTPSRSRHVRPRLEALEDRFLLSGNPAPGSSFGQVISSLGLIGVKDIVLPDGKILVGGEALGNWYEVRPSPGSPGSIVPQFIAIEPTKEIELARFNADGSLDTSFGTDGVVVFQPGFTDTFQDFALQADGKIVVVGTNSGQAPGISPHQIGGFASMPQGHEMLVARFNADGSLDGSFGGGYVLTPSADANTYGLGVAIQGDGKIVVSGQYGGYVSTGLVARYNSDGSLDTTFNPGGATPGIATITSFGVEALYNQGGAPALAVERDGTIVAAFGVSSAELDVYRLNADGSFDSAFGTGGKATFGYPGPAALTLRALTIQTDGKIVAAEDDANGNLYLIRFGTDGSLDSSFGQGGSVVVTGSSPNGGSEQDTGGVVVQSDGKIVVARASVPFDSYAPAHVETLRFNADGSADTTFGFNGQSDSAFGSNRAFLVYISASVALSPDGSAVVVGSWDAALGTFGDPPQASGSNFGELQLIGPSDPPAPTIPTGPLVPIPVSTRDLFVRARSQLLIPGMMAGMSPASITPADAVFQSFATSAGARVLTTAGSRPAFGDPAAPFSVSGLPAPLPVASPSQSAAVARLSGGGGQAAVADDVFNLTGGPDREWLLTLAAVGDAAE